MPEIFQKELDLDTNLAEAFLKFSPYKQKEFLEYIDRSKTRRNQTFPNRKNKANDT